MLWDIRMTRERRFNEIPDPYRFSNGDFYERYRFYKEDIPYLVNEFCVGLEPNTRRNRPVPLDHMMLMTLKYLSSNSFQNSSSSYSKKSFFKICTSSSSTIQDTY